MEHGSNEEDTRVNSMYHGIWIAPSSEFVKCNVGMRWSKKKKEVGGTWILSELGGTTIFYSRRFFTGIWSKKEAYFFSLVWAVESMIFHKCLKVYFSLEWRLLVNAINRSKA